MKRFIVAIALTLSVAGSASATSAYGPYATAYAYYTYNHAYYGYLQTRDSAALGAVYNSLSAYFYTLYANDGYNGDGMDLVYFDTARDLLERSLPLLDQAVSRSGNALLTTARSLCGAAAGVCRLARDDEGLRAGRIQGTVTAKTANTVTITNIGGQAIVINLNDFTRIVRNNVLTLLSALRIGDQAVGQYSPATGLGTEIDATGP